MILKRGTPTPSLSPLDVERAAVFLLLGQGQKSLALMLGSAG